MKTETIEVPNGYELKQVSEGKWELVKSDEDIRDILKDNASFNETGLFFKNGLDPVQRKQRINRFIALSKLQCIADYLNDGWVPDWNNDEDKWHIEWYNNQIVIDSYYDTTCGEVVFKTKELAKKAIEMCGKELIKEVLGVELPSTKPDEHEDNETQEMKSGVKTEVTSWVDQYNGKTYYALRVYEKGYLQWQSDPCMDEESALKQIENYKKR